MSKTRHLVVMLAALLVLAGCSNLRDRTTDGAPPISPLGAMALRDAPVTGDKARFAFAPVSGPPVAVLRDLSAALNREAGGGKLNVAPLADPGATYVVRGYLSTVSDRKTSTLVYVWDVTDATGTRLHRLTGQQKLGAAVPDPWTLVDGPAVERVAAKTIAALARWAKKG